MVVGALFWSFQHGEGNRSEQLDECWPVDAACVLWTARQGLPAMRIPIAGTRGLRGPNIEIGSGAKYD